MHLLVDTFLTADEGVERRVPVLVPTNFSDYDKRKCRSYDCLDALDSEPGCEFQHAILMVYM